MTCASVIFENTFFPCIFLYFQNNLYPLSTCESTIKIRLRFLSHSHISKLPIYLPVTHTYKSPLLSLYMHKNIGGHSTIYCTAEETLYINVNWTAEKHLRNKLTIVKLMSSAHRKRPFTYTCRQSAMVQLSNTLTRPCNMCNPF